MNEWKEKIRQLKEFRRDHKKAAENLTNPRKKSQKAEIAIDNKARPLARLREILFDEAKLDVSPGNKIDNGSI